MKKLLKITLLISIMVISLSGCAGVEDSNNELSNVITMNEKIEDKYVARTEDTVDGKLYAITQSDFKTDMVLGDNYFATQIADIMANIDSYIGKTVEIEGFSLENGAGYTFVGRYSESAVCPDCPPGYSYLEYEWHGDEKLDLGNEETWIKVKGELKKGNDGVEYYYIDAYSIEVMDEWGVATVKN